MATLPKIDLNLFTDSYRQGMSDGMKVPTGFAAFTGGLIEGYDDELKAEKTRQDIEITEEQAPLRQELLQADVDAKNAALEGYRENPELFRDAQVAKAKQEVAALKQKEQLQMKRTEFLNIMEGPDNEAKGKAYLSPEYAEVLASDKQLDEVILKRTFKDWNPEDQQTWSTIQQKGRERDWLAAQQQSMLKRQQDAEDKFMSNETINELADTLKVNPAQLLEEGEFRTITRPKQVPVQNDAGEFERDENGSLILGDNPNPDPSKPSDYETKKIFYHKGVAYPQFSEDPDAVKAFTNYKNIYKYNTKMYPGQDGPADRLREAEATQKEKTARQAAAEAEAKSRETIGQSQLDQFMNAAKINPMYQDAADSLKNEIAANKKSRESAQPQQPTAPQAKPPAQIALESSQPTTEKKQTLITDGPAPEVAEFTPVQTNQAAAFQAVQAIRQTETPSVSSPSVPMVNDAATGTRVEAPGWVNDINNRKAIVAAKARAQIDKITARKQAQAGGANAAPEAPQLTPSQQAAQVTKSPALPDVIQTRGRADVEVVKKIASIKEIQDFPAIIKAVMAQESGGNVNAQSPTMTWGIMQLTARTARGISLDIDVKNPVDNLMGGAILVQQLLSAPEFKDNPMLGLTAYNAGPGPVIEAIKMAKSTDWAQVKKYLPDAIKSPKFEAEWKRYRIDPNQKAKEVFEYADRIAPYFAAFARTESDAQLAQVLKQQGVLRF